MFRASPGNCTLLVALLVAMLHQPVFAAEPDRKAQLVEIVPSEAFEQVLLAFALAKYGSRRKDPIALMTSAKMLLEVNASPSKAELVGVERPAEGKVKDDLQSFGSLLGRAREFAGDRPDLLALIEDVAMSVTRGSPVGPAFKRAVVPRDATHEYRVTFEGGVPAHVRVTGDGDSNLQLSISDGGKSVCSEKGKPDDVSCTWTPRQTGAYLVKIMNRGVANEYLIAHN